MQEEFKIPGERRRRPRENEVKSSPPLFLRSSPLTLRPTSSSALWYFSCRALDAAARAALGLSFALAAPAMKDRRGRGWGFFFSSRSVIICILNTFCSVYVHHVMFTNVLYSCIFVLSSVLTLLPCYHSYMLPFIMYIAIAIELGNVCRRESVVVVIVLPQLSRERRRRRGRERLAAFQPARDR